MVVFVKVSFWKGARKPTYAMMGAESGSALIQQSAAALAPATALHGGFSGCREKFLFEAELDNQ